MLLKKSYRLAGLYDYGFDYGFCMVFVWFIITVYDIKRDKNS